MSASIKVIFFASLREEVGVPEVAVVASSLDTLWSALAEIFDSGVMQVLQQDNVRIAVNQALVDGDIELKGGDEVAFLPPVTGG
jgi:molybdopterin converting factor subunit 1